MRGRRFGNIALWTIAIAGIASPVVGLAIAIPYWGPLLSCSATSGTGLPPCVSLCDILRTGQNIIYFAITLVLFAIAPVLLVWGGIMILIAGASPDRLSSGRKILTGTLIGVGIALASFLIVNTALWAIAQFSKGGTAPISWPTINCTVL